MLVLVVVLVLELVSHPEVVPCSRSDLGTSKTLGPKPFEDENLALTLEIFWMVDISEEARLFWLPVE